METSDVPQPVYRHTRLADLEAISVIEVELFTEPYPFSVLRQLFDFHGDDWLVAELDGQVVGYNLTLEKGGRALLSTCAVAKDFQHRGYGRMLMDYTVRRLRARGVQTLAITTSRENIPATNLIKHVGFVFVEHDDQYFGPDEARDIYEYRL
ncbi:GNAT family N-acetyltransferase [Nocardia transvalensis]|uniref:GNAT family N-acetyltransferase n=1 Tax=Nocardia transvalensis TaxID=37333 RepID=UPI00189430F4|nr:GNAT family N-acetyltransferase [Nocardia transvalensis]MBF6332429.1 GNAT family N-acetyltransferase [Nocardia transvalensis]